MKNQQAAEKDSIIYNKIEGYHHGQYGKEEKAALALRKNHQFRKKETHIQGQGHLRIREMRED